MPSIVSILETGIYVEDTATACQFYQDLFGFELLFNDKRLKALKVNDSQVLLLFEKGASLKPLTLPGGMIPAHDGSGPVHFAFAVPPGEMEAWEALLLDKDIVIESKVSFEQGYSIYFRDTDNHLVELTTKAIWPGLLQR